jgi:membrane-associated phospholipid phosphatase
MQSPPLPGPPAGPRLRLDIGVAILVVAVVLFGAIAVQVVQGDRITLVDAALADALHRQATPEVTRWMVLVTDLHSTVAVSCYAILACLWLAWRRRGRRLAVTAACIAGGLVLNAAMKLAFERARPSFDEPLLTLSTFSFPSGHVLAGTLLYGLGTVWVFLRTPVLAWRLLSLLGALAAVALVAFTRLYLGVHYLSDVAAAFLEGIAWLVLCLIAAERLPPHRLAKSRRGSA